MMVGMQESVTYFLAFVSDRQILHVLCREVIQPLKRFIEYKKVRSDGIDRSGFSGGKNVIVQRPHRARLSAIGQFNIIYFLSLVNKLSEVYITFPLFTGDIRIEFEVIHKSTFLKILLRVEVGSNASFLSSASSALN